MNKQIIIKIPNEQLLEKMTKQEEEIRMSKNYQDRCTEVKNIPDGWLKVTEEIQKDIVKRNGFIDQISCDITCNMLRRAHLIYPNNEKFQKIPLQVRNNKAKQGNLSEKDNVPDCNLYNLAGRITNLYELIDNIKPIIIFAGSQT